MKQCPVADGKEMSGTRNCAAFTGSENLILTMLRDGKKVNLTMKVQTEVLGALYIYTCTNIYLISTSKLKSFGPQYLKYFHVHLTLGHITSKM